MPKRKSSETEFTAAEGLQIEISSQLQNIDTEIFKMLDKVLALQANQQEMTEKIKSFNEEIATIKQAQTDFLRDREGIYDIYIRDPNKS